MRLAAARCPRRFGTKMKQTSRIRKTVARVRKSFGGEAGGSCSRRRERPRAATPNRNFYQLCSNFVPSLFHSALGTMFSKNAKFGRGSISVAHTGPGPNLMRYFACVVRVSGAFCLSSQEVPCWCLCPSWFRNVKTAHGSGVRHPSGICVKPLQSSSGRIVE